MKQKIHRENLMFNWITKNHKIVIGFKQIKREKCSKCGKKINAGSNLCDDCFKDAKKISKK